MQTVRMDRGIPKRLYVGATLSVYDNDGTGIDEDLSANKEPKELPYRLVVAEDA